MSGGDQEEMGGGVDDSLGGAEESSASVPIKMENPITGPGTKVDGIFDTPSPSPFCLSLSPIQP